MSYVQSAASSNKRIRKETERSRLHRYENLRKERSLLDSKIRTQILKLEVYLEDQRREELLDGFDNLENLFSQYTQIHDKCQKLVAEVKNPDEYEKYSIESIDRKVTIIKRKVVVKMDEKVPVEKATKSSIHGPDEIVDHFQELPFDKGSISSKGSVKQGSKHGSSEHGSSKRGSSDHGSSKHSSSKHGSSKSSRSNKSLSSDKAREKARLAGLQVEAKFLEQKQKIEQENTAFKLNLEMAKSEAKIKAFENVEKEHEQDTDKILEDLEKVFPKVDKSEFVGEYVNSYEVPKDDQVDTSEVLKDRHLKSRVKRHLKII